MMILLDKDTLNSVFSVRKAISSLGTADMTEKLIDQMSKTKNNSDFVNIIKEIYKN